MRSIIHRTLCGELIQMTDYKLSRTIEVMKSDFDAP